ncbi:hypothetical protein C8T65DRAFT_699027 [Cerioporus squamosus]|nr:hypothetical protein C8T65DRAFT_699027 [Cerioporus squamosus]
MYTDVDNDLLAGDFEESAFAVGGVLLIPKRGFERNVARPLMKYLLVPYRETCSLVLMLELPQTFVATYVVLSALPVLSFIRLSMFVLTAFTFFTLALAIVSFWLVCILFLFVASALVMCILVRFLLRAHQDGPRSALSKLAEVARGRQLGTDSQGCSDAVDLKKEDPESEADSVVWALRDVDCRIDHESVASTRCLFLPQPMLHLLRPASHSHSWIRHWADTTRDATHRH